MNNAKIWLVVKPTVGVPIFLSAVAVGSFVTHVAVLSSTGWVSDFLSGEELGSSQSAALSADSDVAKVSYDGSNELVVTLPDGTVTKAVYSETH